MPPHATALPSPLFTDLLPRYPAQALNIHLSKPITIPTLSPEGQRS